VRILLFGLVFISPPFLKKLLLQWFCGAKIGYRARIGWFSTVIGREIELGDYSVIRPFTVINLAGEVRLGSYSEISSFNLIYGSSSLIVGDHSYIGPQSLINADEEVRLGHESALGPRSMVFTHGSFLPYTEGYWVKLAGVTIGDKVWCAAGVFIHPGVEIGDERKMSPRRIDAALGQLLRDFAEIGLRRELGLETIQEAKYQLRFRWRGQPYHISLIPSTGNPPDAIEPAAGARRIFVVNCPGWSPPPGAMVFDLATMETPFASDRMHTALRLFMQRYYGVKFTDQGRA
jgi:acetyltransferase-like isoleucine patch superfamily enzyme